ncbi:hypothetical protein DKE48_012495 [Acinetobacter nosocomialis]|nr:hypothetical protein DKE48_012495 [Acinetobacter nosocomialis]
MVGSLTAFHYGVSDFAVYSTFRLHSSYDIYKSACHCLCAVCELKPLGKCFFYRWANKLNWFKFSFKIYLILALVSIS